MWGREWLSPFITPSLKFFSMEQTQKRGGRPPKQAAPKKKSTFKRNIPDVDKMPKTFEVISGNDFILKIATRERQSNRPGDRQD